MTLKIWQLDPANLTPYYNLAICQALAQLDHDVRYVTSRYLYDQHIVISDDYAVDYVYFKGLNHQWLLRFPQLRRILRGISYPFNYTIVLLMLQKKKPDIVHLQWSRLPFFDRFFIQRIKKLDIPIVHTVHNIKSSFATGHMIRRLGEVYSLVDRLILHTESNRRDFLALYPHIAPEKTEVVPHLVTPYLHSIPDISSSDLKAQYGFNKEDFVILFFGIIRQYKGLDTLLNAFENIVQQSHAQLLIAGRPEEKQDFLDIERARQIKNVTVHDWFIPTEKLWQYFHVADIAVFPYREITQSGALIQAMQFGKPVIVTDVGGLPESIDSNGWVIEKNNPAALQQAILSAISKKNELVQKGRRSLEIIQENHDSRAVALRLIDIYQDCITEKDS